MANATINSMKIFEKIQIKPYSVLGTEKILIHKNGRHEYIINPVINEILKVKPNIAIVDPAGTEYISNGPCGKNVENAFDGTVRAGGASKAIYNWLGICNTKTDYTFSQKVRNAFLKSDNGGESIFEVYKIKEEKYTIIHTIGPDYSNTTKNNYTTFLPDFTSTLSLAYENTLKQFILSINKTDIVNTLRLLPISSSNFAGIYKENISQITMIALFNGINKLDTSEKQFLINTQIFIEMCVFHPTYFNDYKTQKTDLLAQQERILNPNFQNSRGLGANVSANNNRRTKKNYWPHLPNYTNAYNIFVKKPYNIFTGNHSKTLKIASNLLSNQIYYNNTNNGINRFKNNKIWGWNYAIYASDMSAMAKSKTIFSDYTNEELIQQVNKQAQPDKDPDEYAVNKLISIHNLTISSILYELKNGPKTNHYMWWICPFFNEAGQRDDLGTYVTPSTYAKFLDKINLKKWIKVLNIIAELSEIPIITHKYDISRIRRFCVEWKTLDLKHWPQLKDVISKLAKKYNI